MDIFFEEPQTIQCEPSGQQLSNSIDATVSAFVSMLKTHVGTLISNEHFRRYTQPVINGRQDTVEINEGFDIVGLIEENDEYNQVVESIKASFDAHFFKVREEAVACAKGRAHDRIAANTRGITLPAPAEPCKPTHNFTLALSQSLPLLTPP